MKLKLLFILGIVVLIGNLTSAQTWTCPMLGYGTGTNAFGWLFNILVLVAIVLLIVWLVKQINKKK